MIAIRIKQLTKHFGSVVALQQLDLTINPGELFFLLGSSGCGKTTLLRCLAGFQAPDQGEIFFGDENVTQLAPHRRNTGMVFQNYALWPHLTVAENVAFGLEERRLPADEVRRRTAEALESVHMSGQAARRPNELSGGQQQRVALARALVVRPRCLLLDEPLSNLDAQLRLELRAEIRRICKEFKLTTVYVTHDQKEALAMSDRVAILDAGRILQVGTPLEVYRCPARRAVASFIGETDFIAGTVVSAGGGRASVDTALGRFDGVLGDPTQPPKAGAAVTLAVHPESWVLRGEGATANCAQGTIGEAVYLGDLAQYGFNCAAGPTLKIVELNPRVLGSAALGARFAQVVPEDVVVLVE